LEEYEETRTKEDDIWKRKILGVVGVGTRDE